MDSGSRSWLALAPGPKTRMPCARSAASWPLKARKSRVVTSGAGSVTSPHPLNRPTLRIAAIARFMDTP